MRDINKIVSTLLNTSGRTEEETKEAMVKAQELMAKYKIEEADILGKQKREVIRKGSGFYYDHTKNIWINGLSRVIAKNYCCHQFVTKKQKYSREFQIWFLGFEEDTQVALSVFMFAYGYIQNWIAIGKEEFKDILNPKELDEICQSYAVGYTEGIEEAFNKSIENNDEVALAIIIPKEVDDEFSAGFVTKRSTKTKVGINKIAYSDGRRDGKNFNPGLILNS